tara:strand:- start:778 stop:2835 length:2058 start_codon:yes stop_codon:yes gene_type:complete
MNKIIKNLKLLIIYSILSSVSFYSTNLLGLSSDWVESDKSKVRLISSKTNSDNLNSIFLGLEYQLEPGWKTYWKSPGSGGFPQTIVWNNSENVSDIEINWPTPSKFEILGLTSIGYENHVIFPLKINLLDKYKIAKINLNINYLVCENICIPGNANLYLEIPPGNGEYTDFFHQIEKAKSRIPTTNLTLSNLNKIDIYANQVSNTVEINLSAESEKNFINPSVYIHTSFGLPIFNPTNEFSFNLKKINSKFIFNKKLFNKENFPIEILINDENHNFVFSKNIILEKSTFNNIIKNQTIYIILISLLGGFILNLMPCVFPVLSIKLMSVLNNHSVNVRLSFIYTSLGILCSFLLLAIFFFVLKELNYSINWGMQFQEPYFLIFILLVLTIFTLSTLGLINIDLPNSIKSSNIFTKGNSFFAKNFFNGFFATILATPCSAPLVGTAITAAFTQSSSILFLIFISMGLGMSTPYLFIVIFPGLVTLLPKPGKWTIYTKYLLSILLIGTIVWVINILLNFYNLYFVLIFCIITVLFITSVKINYFKYLISLFFIIIIFSLPFFNIIKSDNIIERDENWLNFNEVDIASLVKNGNLVFIDITADWCATCQFNKINVLESPKIKEEFKKNNVVLVRADWTKPNNEIDIFLKNYNRFGIPLNAFFSPTHPEGLLLSEILSEKQIFDSIEIIK